MLALLNYNLMPTWLHFASQKSTQLHENVDPKRLPIMHTFSLRFWTSKKSLLGSNLEPSWPHFPSKGAPRRSKMPPRRPKTYKDTTKRFQDASREPPRRPPVAPRPVPEASRPRFSDSPHLDFTSHPPISFCRPSKYPNKLARRYQGAAFYNPPPIPGRRVGYLAQGLLKPSRVLPKPTFQSQGSWSLNACLTPP